LPVYACGCGWGARPWNRPKASGVSSLQLARPEVNEAVDQHERPRPKVMWWTRRFSAPLRETYPAETEAQEPFLELLEQAERRMSKRETGR
jgi:hypothetical protein